MNLVGYLWCDTTYYVIRALYSLISLLSLSTLQDVLWPNG